MIATAAIQPTAVSNRLSEEVYRPGFFERQYNVLKEVGHGAYDRLKDDVINFADHPLHSTAEIAGATVVGGLLVAGAVEAGVATAAYIGVATLSTEMGALFGAAAASALAAPGLSRAVDNGLRDLAQTKADRKIIENPEGHSAAEVQAARMQVRQTLGADVGGIVEGAGQIAIGAGVARLAGAALGRTEMPRKASGTAGDPIEQPSLSTERPLSASTEMAANPRFVHVSSSDSFVPRDVAPGMSFKPDGLWFSADNAWANTMSSQMPEISNGHVFQLDLSRARILDIRDRSDLDGLIAKYGIAPETRDIDRAVRSSSLPRDTVIRVKTEIEWNKVAENWDGINFSNVNGHAMWQKLSGGAWQDDRPTWFRSLDVDSGVVWNASKLKVPGGGS